MNEYDYNMKISTPITYTVEEWEAKQATKAAELDQYNTELQAEESPF